MTDQVGGAGQSDQQEPSLNPSWTATTSQPVASVPDTTTAPLPPVSPPPMAPPLPVVSLPSSLADMTPSAAPPTEIPVQVRTAQPAQSVPPVVAPVLAPPLQSITPPPAMPPTLSSPTASVPPTAPLTPPKPQPARRPLLPIILGLVVVILGAGFGFFWWQGTIFGTPRDARVALTKMAQALREHPAYHTEGTVRLVFNPTDEAKPISLQMNPFGVATARAQTATDEALPSVPCADEVELSVGCNQITTDLDVSELDASTDALNLTNQSYELALQFTGDQVDQETRQLTLAADLAALGGIVPENFPVNLEAELRTIGPETFLRIPFASAIIGDEGNKWIRVTKDDLAQLNQSGQDPVSLSIFDHPDILSSGTRIGYETLGVVKTGHYRYTLDIVKLAEILALSQEYSDLASLLGDVDATFDLWMGVADQLPHQAELIVRSQILGQTIQGTLTMTFANYDQQLAIEVPDESEISAQDLEGFLSTDPELLQAKTRDTQRKADLHQIQSALEMYKADSGGYPATGDQLVKTSDPESVLSSALSTYLSYLPVDPIPDKHWYGYRSKDGTSYELFSLLEDQTDPAGTQRDAYYLYVTTDPNNSVSSDSKCDGAAGLTAKCPSAS